MKIEEACSKPLKEASQLGLPNTTKAMTMLLQWIHNVRTHLQFNRMDSVFFAIKPADMEYMDLLTEWHRFDNREAKMWIEAETWDQYDYDNIWYSGQFLQDSITVELWNRIKVPFEGNVLGPLIFVAVLQVHQTAGTSIVQMLTQQISGMTICSVPGEDVVVLCNQVYELCNRIEALGNPPDDLVNVVSKCFL